MAVCIILLIFSLMFTISGCYAVFGKGTGFFSSNVKMKDEEDIKYNKKIAKYSILITIVLIIVTVIVGVSTWDSGSGSDKNADDYYWYDGYYYDKDKVNDDLGYDLFK